MSRLLCHFTILGKIVISAGFTLLIANLFIESGWATTNIFEFESTVSNNPIWLQSAQPIAIVTSGTIQDFDTPNTGTSYTITNYLPSPSPGAQLVNGGPTDTGKLMRLAFGPPPFTTTSHNGLVFDRTNPGMFDQVVADFDFRMKPGRGRADGFGFALLNTSNYGIKGSAAPLNVAEEPNFLNSLGIGFDIHKAGDPPPESNNNHISIHFNNNKLQEFDVTPMMNLGGGQWIHARIIMRPGGGYSDVTVILTQCGGPIGTIVNQFKVPSFTPYEGRVFFGARSGFQSANHDIDNVRVQFLNLSQSLVAFNANCYSTLETNGSRVFTVTRAGNTNSEFTVKYTTANNTASAGSDYTQKSGTLTFNKGETTKTFNVPILNDSNLENDESFLVSLNTPTGGVLGGPLKAKVMIIDDELAQQKGHWGDILSMQIVAVHAHLLPNRKVMFWPGDAGEGSHTENSFDHPRIWNPVTGTIETVDYPYNLFCSGHTLLADGRLFVAGGHQAQNVGLPKADIYNPFTNQWAENVPDMQDGRWYPTNTTLNDGNVLVVSGDIAPNVVNRLPQVWEAKTNSWRDLINADGFPWPLYPYMFSIQDGRVFNAGPNRDTQFINTSVTGSITSGPLSCCVRSDGSAVMYDDNKIIIIGGSDGVNPPTNTTEVIDLNETPPQWTSGGSMTYPRKYHNATILPDDTILVTGGTNLAGFNKAVEENENVTGEVLAAELWDPITEVWTILAEMQVERIYHSIALLLPDGRVFVGGGGQPDPYGRTNNANAQLFSPPYLFKGPRPTITFAPTRVSYGETFSIRTPEMADITQVNWIRLSSVTHAFNQNQRINHLDFDESPCGLDVTTPANASLAPPGHYMLFILNGNGVPSIAHIIQIGPTTPADSGAIIYLPLINKSKC